MVTVRFRKTKADEKENMSAIFTPRKWEDVPPEDKKFSYGYEENYIGVMADKKRGFENYTRGKTKEQFLALGEPAEDSLREAEEWGFTVEWVND